MSGQLCFSFLDAAEPPDPPPVASSTTLYWRKRIDRAARAAFELGRRRRKPGAILKVAHAVSAAAVAPVQPAYPSRADRNEIEALAGRVLS